MFDTINNINTFTSIIKPMYEAFDKFGVYNETNIERVELINNFSTELPFIALMRFYIFDIYLNFLNNKHTVFDLQLINNIMNKIVNKESSALISNAKINCASLLLPDLSNTTFDDIFEIKLKAGDELKELRNYIKLLCDDIDIEKPDYFEEFIKQNINPSIRNFESKIKDIKLNVIQKFITEIKNPLSYAPLMCTLFTNLPTHLSALISMGLIGANVGIEYIKQLNSIKREDLYFLFKLRKII